MHMEIDCMVKTDNPSVMSPNLKNRFEAQLWR